MLVLFVAASFATVVHAYLEHPRLKAPEEKNLWMILWQIKVPSDKFLIKSSVFGPFLALFLHCFLNIAR